MRKASIAATQTLFARGWARSMDGKADCGADEERCVCGVAMGGWVGTIGNRAPQVRQNPELSSDVVPQRLQKAIWRFRLHSRSLAWTAGDRKRRHDTESVVESELQRARHGLLFRITGRSDPLDRHFYFTIALLLGDCDTGPLRDGGLYRFAWIVCPFKLEGYGHIESCARYA